MERAADVDGVGSGRTDPPGDDGSLWFRRRRPPGKDRTTLSQIGEIRGQILADQRGPSPEIRRVERADEAHLQEAAPALGKRDRDESILDA